MAKSDPVQPTAETVVASEKKCFTNWSAFTKALVAPSEITCQGYQPMQRVDMACHTRLRFNPQTLIDHVRADHGGGFRFKLKETQKPWPGWAEFEKLGVEAHDFRCEVCDKVIPFHPNHIKNHMRPHAGKVRRVFSDHHSIFNFTLGLDPPTPSDEEIYEAEVN